MGAKRDILIRVYGRSGPTGPFPVDAELDDGSYYFGGALTIDDTELLKHSLDIPKYGALLGQALFGAPIQRALEKAFDSADETRLRLCFYPDALELHAYPWERALAPFQGSLIALSASQRIPFSRFVQLPEAKPLPIEDRPVRILFATANPKVLPRGLQPIDVETELLGLLAAVSKAQNLTVSVLPGRTGLSAAPAGIAVLEGATTLERLISHAADFDIVHILCHGLYDSGTTTLCLETEAGDLFPAIDTAIQGLVTGLAKPPRLIYLSACNSATQDPDDVAAAGKAMVGLAPKLVQAGVPAVVAMQDLVEVDLAHKLAGEFYSRLLDSGEVDRALSEARLTVYHPDSKYWAVPVLFLRLRDGRLFASDPVREAIEATAAKRKLESESMYLPLEAVSLQTPAMIENWERASEQGQNSADLWTAIQPFSTGLTVVIGEAGSGKSTTMDRLAAYTAGNPVRDALRTVPLLIDLQNYASVRAYTDSRIQRLTLEAFQALAPSLSEDRFDALMNSPTVRFRLLFDHMDDLPDRQRRDVIDDLNRVVDGYGQHQFLAAMDCRTFHPEDWDQIDRLLVIQPLSIRKVERFLKPAAGQKPDPARIKLLEAIDSAELFELASVPWLLLHMLEQVRHNVLPGTRITVLRDWLTNALYKVAEDGGRSYRAPESLAALAWKMQTVRRSSLQLEEAFQVLNEVRGQRDYNLEDLLNNLVASRILARSGDESVRFTYPPLQSFGAARRLLNDPNREHAIEEIVATLGQPSRVRWWRDTLALLAGMMDDPAPLLRNLVYGSSLRQGEQVFIAALCLRQVQNLDGKTEPSQIESLTQQVLAALLWRSKRANETEVQYRTDAVNFLGAFPRKEMLPHLIGLAAERVRIVEGKPPEFEYSQVRFAAIRALRCMRKMLGQDEIARFRDGAQLIQGWMAGDVATLGALLRGSDEGIRGIAAFALGDLQTAEARRELLEAFTSEDTDSATLWALTDALQALDPQDVYNELALPMITEARRLPQPPTGDKYERLIYLVGQLRMREAAAAEFVDWYLTAPVNATLKGRALVSLGRLHVERDPQWWVDIVHGKLDAIAPGADASKVFLQRKAIEALGQLGDLQAVYDARQDQEWEPSLDEAFFRAAEACQQSTRRKY